jgi:rhodanese-related sulfurtransferase
MGSETHGYRIITAAEVEALWRDPARRSRIVLLDVRTPGEWARRRIPGARLLPVGELNARWRELDPERAIVCVCEHGIRSEAAADFLARNGFANVANLRGGMAQWTGETERGG